MDLDEKRSLLIFTDLDGTFLDHYRYDYAALTGVLARIQEMQIPLIFCSSKTRAEIEALRRQVGNTHPFVVENGGAIYWPVGYEAIPCSLGRMRAGRRVLELGIRRRELLRVLRRIRVHTGAAICSFADMSAAELSETSGLSLDHARMALQREYDEPFEILSADPAVHRQVTHQIEQAGLRCSRGGRYWHIHGDNDKGLACRWLIGYYRHGSALPCSVALGDSANDLPMLKSVDLPYLVRKADGTFDQEVIEALPGVRLADGIGPVGWAAAVEPLLDRPG